MSFEIGEKIKQLRKGKHMSADALGRHCGVSRPTIYNWEADIFSPSYEKLELLAGALDVPMSHFIGEKLASGAEAFIEGAKKFVAAPSDAAAQKEFEEFKAFQRWKREQETSSAPMKIVMPEKNPKRINRRDELAVFHANKIAKGAKIPKWLDLAAGEGESLELSDDYIYFDEVKTHPGLHTAVIRGYSMSDTLQPGDVVVLEEFPGRAPIEMEPRGDNPKNSYRILQDKVREDAICVLSINREPPTLKRVKYDLSRGPMDWRLVIVPEDITVWTPRPISGSDHVKFYAKMIGVVERLPGLVH